MTGRLGFALALLTAAASAAAAEPGVWRACTINTVSVCTPAGCSLQKPAISLFVSDYVDRGTERAAYYRCALKLTKCDRYRAIPYRTGEFVIFSLPERSVFAKLGQDDSITDVAALGDNVFVSRGKCTSGVPPAGANLRSQ
jgi:hypothetical protein